MLQFVNDIIFIYKNNTKNIIIIKNILKCFELAPDLSINLVKSFIRGVSVDQVSLEKFAVMMNCKIMLFLFVYLGIPITRNYKSFFFFERAARQDEKEAIQVKNKSYIYGREGYFDKICILVNVYLLSFNF